MALTKQQVFRSLHQVWATMLDLTLTEATSDVHDDSEAVVTSTVHLQSATFRAAIVLDVSRRLAEEATARLLDMDVSELGAEDIYDAIGELGNMLAGKINRLVDQGCSLTPPMVTEGIAKAMSMRGGELVNTLYFECGGCAVVLRFYRANESN